jgi:hypothetical protein
MNGMWCGEMKKSSRSVTRVRRGPGVPGAAVAAGVALAAGDAADVAAGTLATGDAVGADVPVHPAVTRARATRADAMRRHDEIIDASSGCDPQTSDVC